MKDLTSGRKQILLYLMNRGRASPADIFRKAKPAGMKHPNSALKALKEMKNQKLLEIENVGSEKKMSYKCWVPATHETFLTLAKEFLKSDFGLQFLESKYAQEMINPKLVNYIQEYLKTYWDENQKVAVLQMLRMSPSALHAALFSEGTLSQDSDAVVRKEQPFIFKNPKMFKKHKEFANSSAMALLQSSLISDVFSNQTVTGENIRTCAITLETSIDSRLPYECAGKNDLGNILKISTEQVIAYFKAAGNIKRGQLLSPTTEKEPKRKRRQKPSEARAHRSGKGGT